jgi:hypothetical protein
MSSSRQSSISSTTGPSSPLIGTQHSPELVHVNDADFPNAELDFSSDDDLPDDFAAQTDRFNASIIPPLSPTHILLYLSIPYLKLGPMFLPTSDTPLSHSIPTLLICAAFATFTRELWYLLARYLRKMDIEEIVLDVFARGSDKTRRRLLLRVIVRVGTFIMRVLLASVSLRGSHSPPLLPFFGKLTCRSFCRCAPSPRPRTFRSTRPRAPYRWYRSCVAPVLWSTFACRQADYLCDLGVIFGLLDMAGCGNLRPRERNIIYGSSWTKTGCPLAGNQLSLAPASPCRRGFYLCSIASTAFVFSSSWTIPLYASLRGAPTTTTKRRRRRSFKTLIAASVAITVALVLPLCVFASSSNGPVSTFCPSS